MAAAGALYGLEPFEISETTVNDLARQRQQEGRNGETSVVPTSAAERMRAVAEGTIARVEKMDAPTAKDLNALGAAQRLLDESARLEAKQNRHRPAETDDDHENGDFAMRLLLAGPALPHGPPPAWWGKQSWRGEWQRAQAQAAGKPCECDQPTPWSFDDDGKPNWNRDEPGTPHCLVCCLPVREAA
jgi:hypothetical protein